MDMTDNPFYKPDGHEFTEKGASKVWPGKCVAVGCDELCGVKTNGDISP